MLSRRDRLRLAWLLLRRGTLPYDDALALLVGDAAPREDGQRGGAIVVDDPHPHAAGSAPPIADPRFPGA